MAGTQQFSDIPSVSSVLKRPCVQDLLELLGEMPVKEAVRRVLAQACQQIKDGQLFDFEQLDELIHAESQRLSCSSFCQTLNGTGIILHTNLGRAPLGRAVLEEMNRVLCGYSNLEFDLESGRRGSRYTHIREGLKLVTSAEDVLVVNNNASAVILALNGLCQGGEVILSRGEMVEIGGSFRLPEIMEAAGCKLVEVGATNKTHAKDYLNAINENTRAILKVHRSNFSIEGFTAECDIPELAGICREHNIPLIYDLGSGLLRKPANLPLEQEPDVHSSLQQGADLIMFSCDKLMGGPQGGVLAGRKDLIATLSKTPLLRAMRISKLDLVALSFVVRQYMSDEKLKQNIPVFSMLASEPDQLQERAEKLHDLLQKGGVSCELCDSQGQVGGGTLPHVSLPSVAVKVIFNGSAKGKKSKAEQLHRRLRQGDTAIIGLLREGEFLLDVLTLFDQQLQDVAGEVIAVCKADKLQES